jgi:hypothetical integral membrane protein (TIGR02206 family)
MKNFFDPNERADLLIPMYGTIHLIVLLALPILIVLLIWKKESVKKLVVNRAFMTILMLVFLLSEVLHHAFLWIFRYEPYFERFPLHLCASLSILLPVLILKQKYNWVRFFSYWSISAGFISFANPSFQHVDPWSFDFIHYLVRHYFLFLIPVFLQIGIGFRHRYRDFIRSLATLGVYSFLIFLFDWASGANYLYLGKNSTLELPFLPSSFTVWPWVYLSFSGVGIILLHLAYLGLSRLEKRIGPDKFM